MAFGIEATSHTLEIADDTSITWSHTVGVGANKLVVLLGNGWGDVPSTRQVSSVTYNGTALTEAVDANNTNWSSSSIWYLDSPTADGSPHNIVATWVGTQSQKAGVGVSFNDAATGVAATGTNTGSSANPSCTIASSQSGDICLSVLFSDTGPVATTTADATELFEDEDINSDSDYSTQQQTATGANTVCSWTCSDTTNPWAVCGLAVRAGTVSSSIKTINGLAKASVKTVEGLAIASMKTFNGLA